MTTWNQLEEKALQNKPLTKDEALSVLNASDDQLMDLVSSAKRVREKFFEKKVKLNHLVNVKSGLCPEDCHYCSQSKDSKAPIDKYPLMDPKEIIAQVEHGMAVGAKRACLVASGRGPSTREVNEFCDAVKTLKDSHPDMEVCACLGLLMEGQAQKLKEAGVDAYNHNINTSKSHYEKICGTHDYDDRVETIKKAHGAGLSSCSGILAGMGESNEDLVEAAMSLREQNADSVPVNFLIAVQGTRLAGLNTLNPQRCLKILAMFRLVNPAAELRIAGGREVHLRHLQPIGLMIANSIFIGDYLTTKGQTARQDLEMIRDLGYSVLGQPENFLESILGKPDAGSELKDEAHAVPVTA